LKKLKWWRFRPVDTWFFRGAMPFNSGESHAAQPESQFPPPMQTLQGAIRATLARRQGWPQRDIPSELGDHSSLGQLRLSGPFLERDGQPLYPAPRILVGENVEKEDQQGETEKKWIFLRPGPLVESDCGKRSFPIPEESVEKASMIDAWLTRPGLEAVLQGKLPAERDIYPTECLWKAEPRVGLERESSTRTAKDGHLYLPTHTRLRPHVSIRVGVDGIEESWHPEKDILPLGGEGRLATVEVTEEADILPAVPKLSIHQGKVYYTISLLTPGDWIGTENESQMGQPPSSDFIPGRCPSASIGKPVLIGGWDLKNKCPRPLRPLYAPGSTWWMEADAQDMEKVLALHGKQVGRHQEYGLGLIVIGTWKGADENV
jgi:CRISPR-associated protein Cmr3